MVQLSAPSPDQIPVTKWKSSEKAPDLQKKSDGFKESLVKEKENRESAGFKETAQKSKVAQKESLSGITPDKIDKRVALKAEKGFTLQPADEKMMALLKKSILGESTDAKISEKNSHSLQKAKKKIVPSESADEDVRKQIAVHQFEKNQDLVSQQAANKVDAEKVHHSVSVSYKDPQNERDNLDVQELPAPKKDPTSGVILSQKSPDFSDSREKSSILAKSKKKTTETEVKISVEDKRTEFIRDKSSFLKEVETKGPSNRVTLEFVPSEEVPGIVTRGDQGDSTGKSFVLHASEEQKGAALLDKQLQEKGTQDLTKNIRFVLKDHNEGEIKLILKPESLGKVQINLNLHENNIVGKIIVENNSVRQVFMNNLADLTKALEDSGFSSASLDVSVGGGQTQGRQNYNDEPAVFFNDSLRRGLDDQIPVIYEQGTPLSQINLIG